MEITKIEKTTKTVGTVRERERERLSSNYYKK